MRNIENEGPLPWIPATGSMLVLGGEISVIGLELGVACLQAYIFSLLSCIYLQESVAERKVIYLLILILNSRDKQSLHVLNLHCRKIGF